MPEDNRYNDEEKNSRKGGEFKVPPRTWIVWIAIFGGIILLERGTKFAIQFSLVHRPKIY